MGWLKFLPGFWLPGILATKNYLDDGFTLPGMPKEAISSQGLNSFLRYKRSPELGLENPWRLQPTNMQETLDAKIYENLNGQDYKTSQDPNSINLPDNFRPIPGMIQSSDDMLSNHVYTNNYLYKRRNWDNIYESSLRPIEFDTTAYKKPMSYNPIFKKRMDLVKSPSLTKVWESYNLRKRRAKRDVFWDKHDVRPIRQQMRSQPPRFQRLKNMYRRNLANQFRSKMSGDSDHGGQNQVQNQGQNLASMSNPYFAYMYYPNDGDNFPLAKPDFLDNTNLIFRRRAAAQNIYKQFEKRINDILFRKRSLSHSIPRNSGEDLWNNLAVSSMDSKVADPNQNIKVSQRSPAGSDTDDSEDFDEEEFQDFNQFIEDTCKAMFEDPVTDNESYQFMLPICESLYDLTDY